MSKSSVKPQAAASPAELAPAPAFSVPNEVKHLDTLQLASLTEAFRRWAVSGKGPASKRSRGRVWLVYLLLRYSGARLGEVLALNESTDLDLAHGLVRFGGEKDAKPREVRLPPDVIREISDYLAQPLFSALGGGVFKLDGGYIRRKFYERAAECKVPKDLANPRVMRHSRAVELLRLGVPLTVLQSILGHGSINLTATYLSFSDADVRFIVEQYINKESRMRTSARNAFTGQVTEIRQGMILTEVEITTTSGYKLISVITKESYEKLGITLGMLMTATIKAPFVVVVKEPDARNTSARNRFPGKITRINKGQIAAEVVVGLADGTEVCALVTDVSVKNLELKPGDAVWVLFKVFSVVLNRE